MRREKSRRHRLLRRVRQKAVIRAEIAPADKRIICFRGLDPLKIKRIICFRGLDPLKIKRV